MCYGHLTQKKNTIKISLTKTVFSLASSVDALQNTCVLSKQKVSNVYDRKPDSAPLGILYYFCYLSSVTVLTYTLGTEVFWQKNAKKVMKNHKLKPPTFTLIMLSSIQPVRIPKKITVFLIILVKTSKFSDGQAKMAKNGGLNQLNIYLLTNIFQFYQLPLTSMISPFM